MFQFWLTELRFTKRPCRFRPGRPFRGAGEGLFFQWVSRFDLLFLLPEVSPGSQKVDLAFCVRWVSSYLPVIGADLFGGHVLRSFVAYEHALRFLAVTPIWKDMVCNLCWIDEELIGKVFGGWAGQAHRSQSGPSLKAVIQQPIRNLKGET